MLSSAQLLATPHLLVRDLHCAHRRGGWGEVELAPRSAIVFPRRGAFRRRGRHGEEVIEPGVAYFQRAGEEEEFAHPHDGGDRCTSVGVSDAVLASLLGGDPTLPALPVATSPRDDLVLRTVAAGGARRTRIPCEGSSNTPSPAPLRDLAAPPPERIALPRERAAPPRDSAAPPRDLSAEERVLGLVASVLVAAVPARVAAGRPATARARRALAADARAALAADPALGLVDLAHTVAVSPHHLSRVFREHVGVPVSTYRRRLRLRDALERLDGGESDLARLAADAGFADHAHLTREMRALLGVTPSALRVGWVR